MSRFRTRWKSFTLVKTSSPILVLSKCPNDDGFGNNLGVAFVALTLAAPTNSSVTEREVGYLDFCTKCGIITRTSPYLVAHVHAKWSVDALAGKLFALRFVAIYPVPIGDGCLCQMAGSAVVFLLPIFPGVRSLATCGCTACARPRDRNGGGHRGHHAIDDMLVLSKSCIVSGTKWPSRCAVAHEHSPAHDQTSAVFRTFEPIPRATENTSLTVTASPDNQ